MVTISISSGINSLQFVIVQIEIIMVVAVGTTPATIALILPQSAGRTKVVGKVIGHTIQDKETRMATIRVIVHHPNHLGTDRSRDVLCVQPALASNMCWIPKMAFQE